MKTVRLFDMLSYDGQTWQVVAQDGPQLALKELISGRIRKIGVAELLGDESYLPDVPDRLPQLDSAAVLETLDPVARERVLFLRRHVVEVLSGQPPAELDEGDEDSPMAIRREYDSKLPLKDRIAAKVSELAAAKTPVSCRSLERYIKAYRQDGMAGLVDGRMQRQSSPTGRIDPAVVSLLEDAVKGQTNIDVATRTLCSAILRPVATKSVDAAVLLARALTPLPMQPGWSRSVGFSRSILPVGMIEGDEEIRASMAAKPVIVPESITVDRGKVYVGSTFLNACERLHISVAKAAPRTPTDKPHVERVFAAINSGFTQYLAGYVGPNVVKRGAAPHAEAMWTLAEVQNLLDLWIVAVWQNKPHPGLRHPAMPKKDLTPNEAYAALASVAPTVNVALDRDDYIGLLPVTYRSIQGYGINFESLHYDHPALHPYRHVKSGLPLPANGGWEVRYDPYRLQSIFVRDHLRGEWIEAEWSLAKKALAPFSLDVLRAARKAVQKRDENPSGVDVLAEISRIQTGGARTVKEQRAAKRDSVNKPVVPPLSPTTKRTEPDADEERLASVSAINAACATPRRPAARRIDDEDDD